MILDSTTRKLQVILGEAHTTNALAVVASWFDSGATPSGGPALANTNGTTAVDIVAAPASGYIRQVNELTVFNADTVSHGVTVRYNDNATTYTIMKATLLTGETLTYSKSLGWHTLDAAGSLKQSLGGTMANISDYKVATWTPQDVSGAGLSLTVSDATYVAIGDLVFCRLNVTYPTTSNTATAKVGNFPLSVKNITSNYAAFPFLSTSTTFPNNTVSYLHVADPALRLIDEGTNTIRTNAQVSGLNFAIAFNYQKA